MPIAWGRSGGRRGLQAPRLSESRRCVDEELFEAAEVRVGRERLELSRRARLRLLVDRLGDLGDDEIAVLEQTVSILERQWLAPR